MKKGISYVSLLFFVSFFTKLVVSQVTFTVDSLKVSNVVWLCQNDVVIEDFAYGPHFNMLLTIKNDGKDTIRVLSNEFEIYIENVSKRNGFRKPIFTKIQESDTTLVIPPDSIIYIQGFTDLIMTGDVSKGVNYRLVNFLPQITTMLKNTKVSIEIHGLAKTSTTINNLFTEQPFFIDGTGKESIFDANP